MSRSAATSSNDDRTEELVRAWVELRDRNVAVSTTPIPDGLLAVTWADLALFARDPEKFKEWIASGRALAQEEDPVRDPIAADVPSASSVPRGVDPADFGTFVHEVLQRLASDGNLDAAIDASLPRYDFAKQRAAAAIAAARVLVRHALDARVAGPAPGARVEVPFMVRLDRVLVRGIIDRLDSTADGTTITDYKVGERVQDHSLQVQAYLWAARRAGVSEPLRGRVVYLREGGVEVMDVSQDAALETIALDLDRAINRQAS